MASLRMYLTSMLRCEELTSRIEQAQSVGRESSHLAAVLCLTVCSQSLYRGDGSGTQMGLSRSGKRRGEPKTEDWETQNLQGGGH